MRRVTAISLSVWLMLAAPWALSIEQVVIQALEPGAPLGDHLQYRWDNVETPSALPGQDEAWVLNNRALLFFGYHPNDTLWLRMQLVNRGDREVHRWLVIDYPPIDEITLYVQGQRTNKVMRAGDRFPASEKTLSINVHAFPIQLAPTERATVYLKIRSHNSFLLPIELHTDASLAAKSSFTNWRDAIFYGALLAMCLFNLFASLLLGERAYLFLTGYILSFLLYMATVDGYGQLYLWPLWPEIQQRTLVAMPNFSSFFALLFIHHLIQDRRRIPWFRGSAWLAAIIAVISLILPTYNILLWLYPFAAWFMGSILWGQIYIWRAGTSTNRMIADGWMLVILSWLLDLLEKLGVGFIVGSGDLALLVVASIGALVLTIALVERLKEANQMREAARQQAAMIQQQAMAELEEKVKQRTGELEIANKRLRHLNEQLQQQSSIDSLTGLHNRGAFDEALNNHWKHASRARSPLSLIFFDIDHFKRINDRYGHDVGDECLKLVAHTIAQQVVRETDFVARYGGEEFVALLPHTSARDAEIVAERIRKAVARLTPVFSGAQLSLTISAGVATSTWHDTDESAKRLLKLADLALYKAKRQGRNRVVVADEGLREQLKELFS